MTGSEDQLKKRNIPSQHWEQLSIHISPLMMLELFPRKPIAELLDDVNRKEAKKGIPGSSSSCRHAIFFSKRIVNAVFLSRLQSQQTVVWKTLRHDNAECKYQPLGCCCSIPAMTDPPLWPS